MAAPDIHRIILHQLHLTGIEYMVTGAVAAIAYGEPRMTNDVDIVIRLDAGDGAISTSFITRRRFAEISTWPAKTRYTNGPWLVDTPNWLEATTSGLPLSST